MNRIDRTTKYSRIKPRKNKSKPFDETLKSQIKNAGKRVKSLGLDPEEELDSRNPLEKALNLTKDQNVIFDIFEVIGRPQQALFTGIKEAQEGGDFLEGAKAGISGNDYTYGGELLRNAGMDDTPLYQSPITKKDVSMSDILGFGLDVFADPVDLVPLAGFAKAGKTLKAGGTLKDAYKATDKASDLLFKAGKSAVKGSAKYTDNIVEKVLGKADNIKNAKIANLAAQGVDVSNIYKADALGDYKQLKKATKDIFDHSKSLPDNLVGKASRAEGDAAFAGRKAEIVLDSALVDLDNFVGKLAKTTNTPVQDIPKLTNDVKELVMKSIVSTNESIDGAKVLGRIGSSSAGKVFRGTPESVNAIAKYLDDNGKLISKGAGKSLYKISDDGKSIRFITKNFTNLENFKKNPEVIKAFKGMDLKQLPVFTDKDIEKYGNVIKSKDFKNLVENARNSERQISDIVKKDLGVDFTGITDNENYARAALETQKSRPKTRGESLVDTKSFTYKKYNNAVEQRDLIDKQIADVDKNVETKLVRLENQLSENKKAIKAEQIAHLEEVKIKKTEQFKKNLDKMTAKQKNNIEQLGKRKAEINHIANKLSDDIIDKASKISNDSITYSLSNDITKATNTKKRINVLTNKIYNEDLTEKELNNIFKEVDKLDKELVEINKKFDIDLAKVKGAVDNETLKLIESSNKALDKTGKITETITKREASDIKIQEELRLLKESNADNLSRIDDRIKKLEFEYKGIDDANDAKILRQIEDIQGSNDLIKQGLADRKLSLDYYAGLEDYIKQTTKQALGAKRYNDIFLSGILNDKNYLKTADDLVDGVAPRGFVKIPKGKLKSQLDSVKNLLPDKSSKIQKFIDEVASGDVYLDKDVAKYLKLMQTTNEQVGPFIKIINSVNNTFKKYATLTPGFHVRNMTGNATNLWLGGVPAQKIPGLYKDSIKVFEDEAVILDKLNRGIKLTAQENKNYKLLKQFYEGGFSGAGTKLQNLEEVTENLKLAKGKTPINTLVKKSADFNQQIDSMNRMAMLKYANENPTFLKQMGFNDAIDAVKFTLFDPSNMSDIEKKYVKKVIPFYTFAKQNLLFQTSNIMKNTPKYNKLVKAFDRQFDALEENQYYDYQKDNFQVPIFTDENGKTVFLKTNLPLGDLGDFLSDPNKKLVNSISPLIKTPIENAIGKDLYTGMDVDRNIIETTLKMLGVGNITTDLYNKAKKAIDATTDGDYLTAITRVVSSTLQTNDPKKIELNRLYEKNEQYQNMLRNLKKQGIEVPTINQLNSNTKLKTNRLKRKRTTSE